MSNKRYEFHFVLIRIWISDDGEEIQIPTIFTPPFLKGKGVGRELITSIYQIAMKFKSSLYLTQMTQWSHKYFLSQKAIYIDEDSVRITEDYIAN